MTTRVFVYGSLLSGLGNHHVMERANGRLVTKAELHNVTLHDLGAFPAIRPVPHPATASVAGEVYEVDAEGLAVLDRLEGHPTFYNRRRVTVIGETSPVRCVAYFLTNPTDDPVVRSGDWRAHVSERHDLAC